MARSLFGGGVGDQVFGEVLLGARTVYGEITDSNGDEAAVTLTVWSAKIGGTQLTDLLNAAGAAATVVVTSVGAGQIPEFQGPNAVTSVWVSPDSGTTRYRLFAGGAGGGSGDALTSNPLSQFAPTTSAQLRGVLSDETGTGAAVFATSPTLVTPALGTPSAAVLTNATGLPTSALTGTVAQANLGTGSGGAGTKFLADDQTYKTVAGGGATLDSHLNGSEESGSFSAGMVPQVALGGSNLWTAALITINNLDPTIVLTSFVVDASTTVKGKVELATSAETITGSDTVRAVTPAGAAAAYQPLDSDLTAIAALSTTSYGRAVLALANTAALMALLSASSETVSGIVELATQAETNTGTDDVRAVTPLKFQTRLAAYAQPLDSDLTSIAALTTTSYGRALLELANQAALLTAIGTTSETAQGVVELATQAETNTGTDDVRAVTPLKFQTRLAAYAQPLDSDLTSIAALATTAYGRAFLELANQAALMGLLSASSATAQGIVELATDAEATTGTDTTRATTPANVAAAITARVASATAQGIVELATTAETTTGTDTARAVTPAGVQAVRDLLVPRAQTIINDTTTAHTVTSTMAWNVITRNHASASTETIDGTGGSMVAIGESFEIINLGAGAVTLTPGTGTPTITSSGPGLKLVQRASCMVKRIAANQYYAVGALTA